MTRLSDYRKLEDIALLRDTRSGRFKVGSAGNSDPDNNDGRMSVDVSRTRNLGWYKVGTSR